MASRKELIALIDADEAILRRKFPDLEPAPYRGVSVALHPEDIATAVRQGTIMPVSRSFMMELRDALIAAEEAGWQDDLRKFHAKFQQCECPKAPTVADSKVSNLARALIEEESGETTDAIEAGDLEKIADGIVDSIYVLLWTACAYGINIDPVWKLVQAANMAKEGGATRPDGKILKPPGWAPPDVASEIQRQQFSGGRTS